MTKEEKLERKRLMDRNRMKTKRQKYQQLQKEVTSLTAERDLYLASNTRKAKVIMELQQEQTRLIHSAGEGQAEAVIEKTECVYCLQACELVLSCKHRAHPECVQKNHVKLRMKRVCPECRKPPSREDRVRLGISVVSSLRRRKEGGA